MKLIYKKLSYCLSYKIMLYTILYTAIMFFCIPFIVISMISYHNCCQVINTNSSYKLYHCSTCNLVECEEYKDIRPLIIPPVNELVLCDMFFLTRDTLPLLWFILIGILCVLSVLFARFVYKIYLDYNNNPELKFLLS